MKKRLIDISVVLTALPLAYWLRLESGLLAFEPDMLKTLLFLFPMAIVALVYFPISAQTWHKVGIRDMVALIKVSVTMGLGLLFFKLAAGAWVKVPQSVLLIYPSVTLLLLSLPRLLARYLFEERGRRAAGHSSGRQRNLIVGAGNAGALIAREIFRHPESNIRPIGFLDDDVTKKGVTIMGLSVMGNIKDLPELVQKHQIDEILIAMPSAPGDVIRQIVELAQATKVKYRILPGLYNLLNGDVSMSRLRNVDVEDLLRRDPIQLEMESIADYLKNQVVLVTGAGGSIGSEVVRQVAVFNPSHVIMLGRGENSIFEAAHEIRARFPRLNLTTVIADVKDKESLEQVFKAHKPKVVFHAGAHKHVHFMEKNPSQAIFNNVLGTRNLVELALSHNVERFVNISTDKAVNPTSVMGASKRVAEFVVEWASVRAKKDQSFVSVRFGNVLGSRGSVVPIFKKQIAEGKPITVTHPDMTRYFMTIPEASQLVLQAGGIAENGAVYVLDMGEPVRIVDLAKDLIRLSGLEVEKDIRIIYKGIQPGEKLFEELLTAEEGTSATRHKKIFMARKRGLPEDRYQDLLDELIQAAHHHDDILIRVALKKLIPTYGFEPEMKSLKALDS
jgi:FlaA1/EpsC-like NDP-sugar epimerase